MGDCVCGEPDRLFDSLAGSARLGSAWRFLAGLMCEGLGGLRENLSCIMCVHRYMYVVFFYGVVYGRRGSRLWGLGEKLS